MFITWMGTYPNECPTCDFASFYDDNILVFHSIKEYAEYAWKHRNTAEVGKLYEVTGDICVEVAYVSYITGFHCITDIQIKDANGCTIFESSDGGRGNKRIKEVW